METYTFCGHLSLQRRHVITRRNLGFKNKEDPTVVVGGSSVSSIAHETAQKPQLSTPVTLAES